MFVYAIGCELGLVKIGKANNPEMRLAALQTGSPVQLSILGIRQFDTPEQAIIAERELHTEFGAKRKHGEWFSLTEGDLKPFFSMAIREESRIASISDFYSTWVPTFSEFSRSKLRELHNSPTDEILIKTLIEKCATGQLASQHNQ